MDIREIFKPIEEDLIKVEERLHAEAHVEFGPLAEVITTLIESGGKRIRPALVLLAGRLRPVNDHPLVLLATATELLHIATLIHDDLLDKSPLRRGVATISSRWSEKATVLAGDYLLAVATKLSSQVRNFEINEIFAETALVICQGEIRQDFSKRASPDRGNYLDHIYSKTASLFAACTETAAVLSRAPDPERLALREYGRYLGIAFQIIDDVLDFVGTQREFGKPVGSDLRQGVVTLPTIYFYEMDLRRRETLNSIFAHNGHSEQDLDEVIEWIRTSPAIGAAQEDARQYAEKAKLALEIIPHNPYRASMCQLADYVVDRKT